jgi:peptide/nickel transport system permease protein
MNTLNLLRKDPLTLVGLVIIIVIVAVAIFAPYIAPNDPLKVDIMKKLASPDRQFPLGCDSLGRCVLSRIIFGARTSLSVATICLAMIMSASIILGTITGYVGGRFDAILMRFVDVILSIPDMVLTLAIVGILGPGLINVVIGMVSVRWINYTRIVRGLVMSIKNSNFVVSARAAGASDLRIMFRHILPNVVSPVIVMATLDMGNLIISLAGFSFLGLGAQPPTPEWGMMLNDGRKYLMTMPEQMIYPGLAILVVVVAFNLLGDGLRDMFDPKFNKRRLQSVGCK